VIRPTESALEVLDLDAVLLQRIADLARRQPRSGRLGLDQPDFSMAWMKRSRPASGTACRRLCGRWNRSTAAGSMANRIFAQ